MQGKSLRACAAKQLVLATATTLMLNDAFHAHIARGQTPSAYGAVFEWDHYATGSERDVSDEPLLGFPYVVDGPATSNGVDATQYASDASEPLPLSPEDAFEGDDNFGGPDDGPGGPGGPGDEPGYGIAWYPSRGVTRQGTDLGFVRQSLIAAIPVWHDGADAIMMSANVDESHFSGQAVLPTTLRPFPSDLWNIGVGLNGMHQFSNGWSGGLMATFSSPSDQPFHALRDMSYGLGTFLQIPAKNGRDSWMLGIMYSPSGPLNIPIPLIGYNWNPSEKFHLNIGLPSEMTWQATDVLSFNLSYSPILDIDALATYKLSDNLRAYGGYQYASEAYFLADRVDTQDQFYAIEQRLVVGIKRDVWQHMTLDVNAGYAFDRHYGEGDDQTNLHDRVNIEPGAFLGGRLNLNF